MNITPSYIMMIKNSDSFDYMINNHTHILMRLHKSEKENRLRMSESSSKNDFELLRMKARALNAAKIILETIC